MDNENKPLTKKEIKEQECRQEEERKREERYQERVEYAENHGMFAESLSYEDILEWNNYNETMAAAHFIALDKAGWNEDAIIQATKVLAHNTEILIRQNEVIIRLLKGLLEK